MVTPPLVLPSDLSDFPGAPFKDALVAAGSEMVRREAGWHIAPSVSETVAVDSDGGQYLFVRSLMLTAVSEARDVTDPDESVTLSGYRVAQTTRFRAGCVYRAQGWPRGVVELDITHGYDECPADLLPVVVDRMSRRVQQESLGSRSVTFFSGGDGPLDSTLTAYKIPPRP